MNGRFKGFSDLSDLQHTTVLGLLLRILQRILESTTNPQRKVSVCVEMSVQATRKFDTTRNQAPT